MMEFIVLGIVPGTRIQLSPMGVVLLWTFVTIMLHIALELYLMNLTVRKYSYFGNYCMIATKKHMITRRLRGTSKISWTEEYSGRKVAALLTGTVVRV